jgi:hypothetical protein
VADPAEGAHHDAPADARGINKAVAIHECEGPGNVRQAVCRGVWFLVLREGSAKFNFCGIVKFDRLVPRAGTAFI